MTVGEDTEKLLKMAQEVLGKWIYDKTRKNEYLYAYDAYDWGADGDVKLCCVAINADKAIVFPYVRVKEIWMSEFEEYYLVTSSAKCLKAWETIKAYYDTFFKGVE